MHCHTQLRCFKMDKMVNSVFHVSLKGYQSLKGSGQVTQNDAEIRLCSLHEGQMYLLPSLNPSKMPEASKEKGDLTRGSVTESAVASH